MVFVSLMTSPDSICHAIAGVTFRLGSRIPGYAITLKDSFRPFEIPRPAAPDGEYVFEDEAAFPFPPPDGSPLLQDSDTWRFGRCTDGRLFIDTHYAPERFWQHAALLAPDFSTGTLFPRKLSLTRPSPVSIHFPVDEQLFLHRIGWLGGALLHTCGVAFAGRAWLFCGKSGAGKSTTARLWQAAGAELLNDDRMVLRMINGIPHACSTPWHGTIGEVKALNLPLGGVFQLEQARGNEAMRLSPREGLHRLAANLIAPFHLREPMQAILDTLAVIADATPVFRLRFTPDARAVEAARRAAGV